MQDIVKAPRVALLFVALLISWGGSASAQVVFLDNFNRPDSSFLGSPSVGGTWQEYNVNNQSMLVISNEAFGFEFAHVPNGQGFWDPLAAAPLSSAVGSVPVTTSFTFSPSQDGRSSYTVGLMSAEAGYSPSPWNMGSLPNDGVGIILSRSGYPYTNSQLLIQRDIQGQNTLVAIADLPFQLDTGASYQVGFTLNPNGDVSASISNGSMSRSLSANVGPLTAAPDQVFIGAEEAPSGAPATQLVGFDNLSVSTPSQTSTQNLFDHAVNVSTGADWGTFRAQYNLDSKYPQSFKDTYGSHFLLGGIGATFVPSDGSSLQQAAAQYGYTHFNWVQFRTLKGDLVSLPYLPDPPLNCYDALTAPCPNRDNLPWYLDEQFSVGGTPIYSKAGVRIDPNPSDLTRLEAWTPSSSTLLFSDAPDDPYQFITCLVGVRADGTGDVINYAVAGVSDTCFKWHSYPAALNDLLGTTEGLGGGTGTPPSFDGFLSMAEFAQLDQSVLQSDGITVLDVSSSIPEPALWTTMLIGFFGVGFMLRRTRNASALATA